ncbi:MAG: hypothetical protein DRN14_06405 [Thermoplasmata archaeon]|nr:MAG: hypothetical protein DRN14_06405 [Thermoplasmata archaeon]
MIVDTAAVSDKDYKRSRHNSRLFIFSRLDLTAMLLPVIVIIWKTAGLSFNEMLLLQGIFALFIVLTEVPSGAISDSFKRKYVLIAGNTVLSIATIIYYLGRNFLVFSIAESLFGIGVATISGSDTSLLYDTLILSKEETKFKKILGKAIAFNAVASSASMLIGGLIGTYYLRLPVLLVSISFVLRAIICLLMIEPERVRSKSVKKTTTKSAKLLFTNRTMIAMLFSYLSVMVVQRVAFWAYQPKLLDNGFNSFYIGLLFASLNILTAIGSIVISKIKEHHDLSLLLFIMILETANIFVLWYFNSLIILSTMVIVQFVRGGRGALANSIIQRRSSSDLRATIISLISAVSSLLYFLVSLMFKIFDMSLNLILFIMLLTSILITIIFGYFTTVLNNKNNLMKTNK